MNAYLSLYDLLLMTCRVGICRVKSSRFESRYTFLHMYTNLIIIRA